MLSAGPKPKRAIRKPTSSAPAALNPGRPKSTKADCGWRSSARVDKNDTAPISTMQEHSLLA